MDKVARIRQEIERLYDGEAPKHDQQCDFSDGYFTGLSVISNFLDTLSEEPDKSLEEAADNHIRKVADAAGHPGWDWTTQDIADAFIAGAEWQKGIDRSYFLKCYEQAEKDLGWHPSTEHPPVDEEVIVLLGRYEDFPQIAFGHIVDQSIAIDYNGWNIPGVMYWMPMPKIKEEEK